MAFEVTIRWSFTPINVMCPIGPSVDKTLIVKFNCGKDFKNLKLISNDLS